jgi:hypothetical protein
VDGVSRSELSLLEEHLKCITKPSHLSTTTRLWIGRHSYAWYCQRGEVVNHA